MSLYLGPEGTPYEGGYLLHNLVLFGRVCKALGMDVTVGRLTDAARALELIHLGRRADVYHTLRALLVTRHSDLDLFDEAFRVFWRKPADEWSTLDLQSLGEYRRKKKTQFLPPTGAAPDEDSDGKGFSGTDPNLIAIVPTFSTQELLRTKDFAEMTASEIIAARQLIARLGWSLGVRTTRRFRPAKGHRADQIDQRRAFRANMRYAGEPLGMPMRRPKIKPRPP